jgi:chromosome segregation ATPase
MSARSPELSPVGRAELAELKAELPRLETALREAEARYAEEKPRYDRLRREYPKVAEEEAQKIRSIGSIRDRIEQVGQRIARLKSL